jgi:hypothetical protein
LESGLDKEVEEAGSRKEALTKGENMTPLTFFPVFQVRVVNERKEEEEEGEVAKEGAGRRARTRRRDVAVGIRVAGIRARSGSPKTGRAASTTSQVG